MGSGKPDSPNSVYQLMSHPYFSDVNFGTLHQQKIPLQLPVKIINQFDLPLCKTSAKDAILKEGILQKRNEWRWKQDRFFVL